MPCSTCGGNTNCGNCGRTYDCSCGDSDLDPVDIKCTDGEPCEMAISSRCVYYAPEATGLNLPANTDMETITRMVINGDVTFITTLLTQINTNPTLKALFCSIVNTC